MKTMIKYDNSSHICVTFQEYTREHIKKIKQIKGYSWNRMDKCWKLPFTNENINKLASIFKNDNILLNTRERMSDKKPPSWVTDVLTNLKEELILKGYSPKTQKAYIGHTRRFLLFFHKEPQLIHDKEIRKYLLFMLVNNQNSHSYVNQTISAIKFCIGIY